MLFAVRLSLPDRPGMLGAVATALSHGGANILTLDVIEREEGSAVDDLIVEAPEGLTEGLERVIQEASEATIEAVRPLGAFPNLLSPMELAADLAERGGRDALPALVDGIPGALWTSWCVALEAGASGEAIVIAASPCSSSLQEVALPWLPLEAGARLEVGDWMPAAWRMGKLTYEMAAAPLGSARVALLAARRHGPRFRSSEIANLALLARIASAASYSRAP